MTEPALRGERKRDPQRDQRLLRLLAAVEALPPAPPLTFEEYVEEQARGNRKRP